MKLKKIYLLGISGSGKTYLGNLLSQKLKIPFYDSDDIRFIKKFTKARDKKQRKKLVDKILKKSKWIIDGRGTDWDRHAMKKSDLVIWLQTPIRKRTLRILKRYKSRRKGKLEENISSLMTLLKYSSKYKYSKGITGFKEHKKFLKENDLKYIVIKNNKQLKKLLEDKLSPS